MSATAAALRLATWLAQHNPVIYQVLAQQLQSKGLAGLGDGVTTTFDAADSFIPDPQSFQLDTSSLVVDPSSLALDPSTLTAPAFDVSSFTMPSINFDTIAPALSASSSSSGLSSSLGAVGSFLSSATGISALTNIAKIAFGTGSAQSQTIATQAKLASSGQNPAPIGYGVNSAGQVVPVYTGSTVPTSVAAVGTPTYTAAGVAGLSLTPSSLASLIPSSAVPWVIGGLIGLTLLSAARSGKRR